MYLAVGTSGVTTLAIELSASRLLGPVFGTSNLIWAIIIGLMLIYLSAGYFLGGRWADRDPSHTTFYQIAAWGGLTAGLAPTLARLLLPLISRAGLPVGTSAILSIFALFAVPVVLLGCISPFAIRLSLDNVTQAGQVSGRIYAVSTLGSIIGSLAPVLYLLPEVGTSTTFLVFAEMLMIVSLLGMSLHERRRSLLLSWIPLVPLILWILS